MTVQQLITKLSTLPKDKIVKISVYDYVNCIYNTENVTEVKEEDTYIDLY